MLKARKPTYSSVIAGINQLIKSLVACRDIPVMDKHAYAHARDNCQWISTVHLLFSCTLNSSLVSSCKGYLGTSGVFFIQHEKSPLVGPPSRRHHLSIVQLLESDADV
jgi:hypothetical protein